VGGRPTLQTVADELGVSRATVSNAYNRPDQLSPALRERILEAAQRLGYAGPDPAARGLRRGQTGTIGVLVGETLSYVFRDAATGLFLEGMARAGERAGTSMLLIPSPKGEQPIEAIGNAAVDGFCLNCVPDNDPGLHAVLGRRLPTVVVEGWSGDAPVARVDIDQFGGARSAAEHLTGLGHSRFGIITAMLGQDRYAGWVDARRLARADAPVDRERVRGFLAAIGDAPIYEAGGHGFELGRKAGRALLDAHPGITAILADSDLLALGALRAATETGRSVPTDLSITGFDDIPLAASADPPLTTVSQPLTDKGEAAYGLLQELLSGRPPRQITLPIELVVRGSTGPAPG
jgi:DNA-binding LacI/PurR family transcriptional regulator